MVFLAAPAAAQEMDHCAMGHLPPEQCPPKDSAAEHDHSKMAHSQKDHSQHQAPDADEAAPVDHSQMNHSQHQQTDQSAHAMPMDKSAPGAAPEDAVPARAFEGPRHAADAIWGEQAMAPSRAQLARENGAMKTGKVMIERLEARIPIDGGETGYVWDAQAWYGGDINRIVFKTEGEGEFSGSLENAEVQALYSRAIGPFFDLQAGVRFDPEPDTRTHAVLGVQGLAPYMFHVDGALFLSDRGDLTARIEAEYDQKLTQQLILQPRIEVEISVQDIPEREIGAGITKVEPGFRLRYEFVPEFAPYVGIEYEAKLGETADIARAVGEDPDGFRFILGLRAWF
nr:copper resistance protein B [Altererythrobacter lutimaris]